MLKIPLMNEAVLLPRGKKLVVTLGAATTRSSADDGDQRDDRDPAASRCSCPSCSARSPVRGWPTVRIGTCSWADEALSKWFYPPKLPAKERLAWYAEHFDTVEVDSTFYRLPSESMVQGWADRTPDGFTMHVKAFGLMTRHPVKLETIPPDLRDEMPVDERGRVDRPPRELRGEVFRLFLEALEPLRAAGKLGGILMQLPPYVVYKDASLDYLAWAREQLAGDEMLVEFRHRSWLDDENRAKSLAFLETIGAGVRRRRRAALRHREEPRPDRRRDDLADGVRPLPRPQPRDVEQARRLGGRALRLPLLRRGAR